MRKGRMAFSTNISSLRDCLNAAIGAMTYQRGFYQYAYETFPVAVSTPITTYSGCVSPKKYKIQLKSNIQRNDKRNFIEP
jgi:hypothetical protein